MSSPNNLIFSTINSLSQTISSSLSPFGHFKMLHTASGDISVTKSGSSFLSSVTVGTPLAKLFISISTSLTTSANDGSISVIIFMSELARNLEFHINEGVHPRSLHKGLNSALNKFNHILQTKKREIDLEPFIRSYLGSRLEKSLSSMFSAIVLKSIRPHLLPFNNINTNTNNNINNINTDKKGRGKGKGGLRSFEYAKLVEISLLPVPISDSRFIGGLVLDHGPRHPQSPSSYKDVNILLLNINLETEKSEVNSSFVYNSPKDRKEMAEAEKNIILERAKIIVGVKNRIRNDLVVINYGGIEPFILEYLHDNGIAAIRRCKKRNMERICDLFGGRFLNKLENNTEDKMDYLAFADRISVKRVHDEVYTYIEKDEGEKGTIVIGGATKAKRDSIKEAVENCLLACFAEKSVVEGAGKTEMTVYKEMIEEVENAGEKAFVDSLLGVPKTLAGVLKKGKSEEVMKRIKGEGFIELDEESEMVVDGFKCKSGVYNLGCRAMMEMILVDKIVAPKN